MPAHITLDVNLDRQEKIDCLTFNARTLKLCSHYIETSWGCRGRGGRGLRSS